MELNFLGCGSAWCPELGNTAAWFCSGDTLFLLDCGETVFRAAYTADILNQVRRAVILITHMHSDHCGSLPTMVAYLYYRLGAEVTVVHPDGGRIRQLLETCGAEAGSWKLVGGEGKSVFGEVTIEPCAVRHVGGMHCSGYIVSVPGDAFFFSGDSSRIPENVRQRFLNGEIQRLYVDTCVGPNNDHGELSRHCAAIPEEMRSRVICMHLNPKDMDTIRQAGFRLANEEEK